MLVGKGRVDSVLWVPFCILPLLLFLGALYLFTQHELITWCRVRSTMGMEMDLTPVQSDAMVQDGTSLIRCSWALLLIIVFSFLY